MDSRLRPNMLPFGRMIGGEMLLRRVALLFRLCGPITCAVAFVDVAVSFVSRCRPPQSAIVAFVERYFVDGRHQKVRMFLFLIRE